MYTHTSPILLVPSDPQLVPHLHAQLAGVGGGVGGDGLHPVLLLSPVVVDVIQAVEHAGGISVERLHQLICQTAYLCERMAEQMSLKKKNT